VTGRPQPQDADQRCVELVELLTAYLDGTLPEEVRTRFDAHLDGCAGCRAALAQWRTVERLAGQLRAEDVASLDPYVRDQLIGTLVKPRRR
jgi:anti-sigma factor RsiW